MGYANQFDWANQKQGIACVQKFDSSGNYLGQFGSFGTGNGQFRYPYGIAFSK